VNTCSFVPIFLNFYVTLLLFLFLWEGSGCTADGLQRVMRGEHIGTLFHKDAHLWFDLKETGARDMAVAARDASRRLQVFYCQNHSNISRIR
jgi:hypothetical protein